MGTSNIAGYQRGAFYRQFDSYLEGHGFELAYFLCFPEYAKTKVDIARAFITVYGEDKGGHLTPLDVFIDFEEAVANRVPFLEDFLYIADAGDNPYIKVYDSLGSFGNEKPLRQIFEGTPQQLIRKLGRAEDMPNGGTGI